MKKLTTTKYVADEWQCWKGEEAPYWYIGETSSDTYLAMTYTERNARLIAAAPEMYRLLESIVSLLSVHSYSQGEAVKIHQLLARIDGEEAEHEETD